MDLSWEFLGRVLAITILDLTLGGDNAVVIGMAVRSLPPDQRRWGIFWGAFGAVGLRVACTFVVAQLLLIPFLQFAGGLMLIWIAWKLIVSPPGEGEGAHVKAASGLFDAVKIIVMADIIMSLDNMLAVGAASHGSFFLLMFGLGLSIPIILFCSALVAMMMNKWPWLVYVGGGILGWVAGEMIVADKLISPYLAFGGKFIHYGIPVVLTVAIVAVGKLCQKKESKAEVEKQEEAVVAK